MPTPEPCPPQCADLVHELSRHGRMLHLLKHRLAPQVIPPGLDGAALGVLMALVKGGPRRQGELAEVTFLDPSTVSRYTAQLVRAGLVSRRPDPADGRAVQLVATAEGTAMSEHVTAQREALIGSMLAGWTAEDAATLVALLRRFNDEMEARTRGEHDPPARPARV